MRIRNARKGDLDAIIRMTLAFLASGPYEWMTSTPARIAALFELVQANGVIFVAEVDLEQRVDKPTVVGMLSLIKVDSHPLTGQSYGDELVWWVDPEHRNGTIGPRLLGAAEKWATTAGLSMLKMVAPAKSDVGTFYERQGYRLIESAWAKDL